MRKEGCCGHAWLHYNPMSPDVPDTERFGQQLEIEGEIVRIVCRIYLFIKFHLNV